YNSLTLVPRTFYPTPAISGIYSLSLHDALPISGGFHFVTAVWGRSTETSRDGHIMKARYTPSQVRVLAVEEEGSPYHEQLRDIPDRKSTRLNSSHVKISYAVFCLKKKRAAQSTE